MSLVVRPWTLAELVLHVENDLLLLPAFQRSYVWPIDKEVDLFDSLVRGIPTGSVTLAKPSFPIGISKIDLRDDDERGNTPDFELYTLPQFRDLTAAASKKLGSDDYKCQIILDGQQRITSIYRVLKGIDNLFISFGFDAKELDTFHQISNSFREISADPDREFLSIDLHHAFCFKQYTYDDKLSQLFRDTTYFDYLQSKPSELQKSEENRYRRLLTDLGELLRSEKCISVVSSDANEDDLLDFFQRSNTQGTPLSFLDLMNAKTFKAFSKHPEGSFSQAIAATRKKMLVRYRLRNMDDNFTRIRCFEPLSAKSLPKGANPLSKTVILNNIDGDDIVKDFNRYANWWPSTIDYLNDSRLTNARDEMSFPLMVIPTFFFLKCFNFDVEKIKAPQTEFFCWWYWASVFSRRYSFQTNEAALEDIELLRKVATFKADQIPDETMINYSIKVGKAAEIIKLSGRSGHFQRAIAALSIKAGDAPCIFSKQPLSSLKPPDGKKNIERFDYHHIFPKAFLASSGYQGLHGNSIANLMYAQKQQRGGLKTAPSRYLNDPKEVQYSDGLLGHFITEEMLEKLKSGYYDARFEEFLTDRAEKIFNTIEDFAGADTGYRVLQSLKSVKGRAILTRPGV